MIKIKEKEAEFIASHYKGVSTRKMVPLLYEATGTLVRNSTMGAYYKKMGYNSGVEGRFQKGHAGLNDKQLARIKSTQYKKGHISSNKKDVGTISHRNDGYVYVKVGDDDWEREHNLVWEKANGKIPKGYRVLHLDGNRSNNDLDNLILMSDTENVVINGLGLTKDPDINKTILLTTRIKQKVKNYENK